MPMSEALKDGDQVVVTAGPLLPAAALLKHIVTAIYDGGIHDLVSQAWVKTY